MAEAKKPAVESVQEQQTNLLAADKPAWNTHTGIESKKLTKKEADQKAASFCLQKKGLSKPLWKKLEVKLSKFLEWQGLALYDRPMVWLTLCFGSGIIIQRFTQFTFQFWLTMALFLIAISALLLWSCKIYLQGRPTGSTWPTGLTGSKGPRGPRGPRGPTGPIVRLEAIVPIVPIILVLCTLSGALWLSYFDAQNLSSLIQLESKRVNLRGDVCGQPEKRGDKLLLNLRANGVKASGQSWRSIPPEKVKVHLFEAGGANQISYGNQVTVHGKLVLPKAKGNPGEFDYRQYLKFRQIHTLLYVYHPEDLVVHREPDRLNLKSPVAGLLQLREKFSQLVYTQLQHRQAELLLAMLFGEQGAVDRGDLELFRETGLAHALSVSGFHVGIVLMLVLALCRLAKAGQQITLMIALIVLVGYSVLSGFSVTVVRSALMGMICLLATHLGRERNLYHALAVSGLAILLWNPNFLFDPGFQLSFVAVMSITSLVPFLDEMMPKCLLGREKLISVPLGAQLGTLPLIAWHFSLVSPLAVLANILLVPLMSTIVILGLLSFVFFKAAFISELFLQTAGFLIEVVVWAGSGIASLPGTLFYVARPSFSRLTLYYCLIFAAVGIASCEFNFTKIIAGRRLSLGRELGQAAKLRLPHRKSLSIFVLVLALFTVTVPGSPGRNLTLVFLDVGQGDAIFVRSPSGTTALIDGGGVPDFFVNDSYEPGRDTVLPFLRRLGRNRVDLLINTHPDADHLSGLQTVLEELSVGQVMTPPVSGLEAEYDHFLSTARRKKVPHRALAKGDQISLDKNVIIQVLAPDAHAKLPNDNVNDFSLVLAVSHGENSFLLTGDVEEDGIRSLMAENTGENSSLECEVLKIPHHGSRGSFVPKLYAVTRPKVAVISVGKNNNFGHPSREVMQHLLSLGTILFRTDKHGAVIVTSDGKRCFVQSVREDP